MPLVQITTAKKREKQNNRRLKTKSIIILRNDSCQDNDKGLLTVP